VSSRTQELPEHALAAYALGGWRALVDLREAGELARGYYACPEEPGDDGHAGCPLCVGGGRLTIARGYGWLGELPVDGAQDEG
jgi:hypothetical protein